MFESIINKWRESTRRFPSMTVEEKCRAGMEVSYTTVLTQENVIEWVKKNITNETSVFLQILEQTSNFTVLRQSVIAGEDNQEVKVRTIYALVLEEGLKIKLLGNNGCIHYKKEQ